MIENTVWQRFFKQIGDILQTLDIEGKHDIGFKLELTSNTELEAC